MEEFTLEKSRINVNNVASVLTLQETWGSMKETTLRKRHLNFPRKTNVYRKVRNHVNEIEQEVKTLMLGPQVLQRTCKQREKLEILV